MMKTMGRVAALVVSSVMVAMGPTVSGRLRVAKDMGCGMQLLHALRQEVTPCSLSQIRLIQHPFLWKQLLQQQAHESN